MEQEEIRREICDLLAILDEEDYPETYRLLGELSEQEVLPEPYEVATGLCRCDETAPMEQVEFDFLVELYESEIERGNADAMNDLGVLYYDGRGCEQDFTKAVHFYEMAAGKGHVKARENLGYCYYYGRNMPVDYEKAYHCFALGALSGELISLYKVGDMYAKGLYVKKDPLTAYRIYSHCLDRMTDEAAPYVAGPLYLRLGNAFLKGEGTPADAQAAMCCFQRAEIFLYDMVKRGDEMYRNSLCSAIEGQTAARAAMTAELPGMVWLDGKE